jgi:hypothetical protein
MRNVSGLSPLMLGRLMLRDPGRVPGAFLAGELLDDSGQLAASASATAQIRPARL